MKRKCNFFNANLCAPTFYRYLAYNSMKTSGKIVCTLNRPLRSTIIVHVHIYGERSFYLKNSKYIPFLKPMPQNNFPRVHIEPLAHLFVVSSKTGMLNCFNICILSCQTGHIGTHTHTYQCRMMRVRRVRE